MPDQHVVATIPARPESQETVADLLRTLAQATREEEGCLSYELYRSASAPTTFVTVERWTDQAALEQHLSSAHVAAAIAGSDGHLAGEISIHPLVPDVAE